MVRDLLNPSAGYLEMREDAKGGVQVANLSEVSTSSTEEVKNVAPEPDNCDFIVKSWHKIYFEIPCLPVIFITLVYTESY